MLASPAPLAQLTELAKFYPTTSHLRPFVEGKKTRTAFERGAIQPEFYKDGHDMVGCGEPRAEFGVPFSLTCLFACFLAWLLFTLDFVRLRHACFARSFARFPLASLPRRSPSCPATPSTPPAPPHTGATASFSITATPLPDNLAESRE